MIFSAFKIGKTFLSPWPIQKMIKWSDLALGHSVHTPTLRVIMAVLDRTLNYSVVFAPKRNLGMLF